MYGTVFGLLGPNASGQYFRVGQETMEHWRGMILRSAYAAQFVLSAKLVDIVTQNHRHEVGLNAFGLR
jgi:hypothetical protein